MASISGTQFIAAPNDQGVVPALTYSNVSGLPPAAPGVFSIYVYDGTGTPPSAAAVEAEGYTGYVIVSNGGLSLTLVNGAIAVTDSGTGNDTITIDGSDETVSGNPDGAAVTVNSNGFFDVINSGGNDTITIGPISDFDTVNGQTGSNLITDYGSFDLINPGSGNDTIVVNGYFDTVTAGTGSETITVTGAFDSITGSAGPDSILATGSFDTITGAGGAESIVASGFFDKVTAGTGADTISLTGSFDTATGGIGPDTFVASGSFDEVKTGTGLDTISVSGNFDSVVMGAQGNTTAATVNMSGQFTTLVDGPGTYSDTVVGFSHSSGDKIELNGGNSASFAVAHASPENGGHDTLITLNDGSTILLKGITHIDSTFFS